MAEPINPVERVLAEVLAEKLDELEQLRADVAALRLQLAVANVAHPNPPQLSAAAYGPRWTSSVRARALLISPPEPTIRLPFPRSPEDDRAPRRRHPDLPPAL
jgi:hypothetical protein